MNILIDKNCDVKLCDFGMASIRTDYINNDCSKTSHVTTKWYRAPEILLKFYNTDYTEKVDIWAMGCIIAEMILREILFSELDSESQIAKMISILGPLPESLLS